MHSLAAGANLETSTNSHRPVQNSSHSPPSLGGTLDLLFAIGLGAAGVIAVFGLETASADDAEVFTGTFGGTAIVMLAIPSTLNTVTA